MHGYLSTPINIESTIDSLVSSSRDIDRREHERRVAGKRSSRRPYFEHIISEVTQQDDGTYRLKITNFTNKDCVVVYYADSQQILRSYKVLTPAICRW